MLGKFKAATTLSGEASHPIDTPAAPGTAAAAGSHPAEENVLGPQQDTATEGSSASSSSIRTESSPIREALLHKFAAKFASSNLAAASDEQLLSDSQSCHNAGTSAGTAISSPSSLLSGQSAPESSPSWLHQVKGRIAKTVEEKYSEYKSEREKRQRLRDCGASASLELPEEDAVDNLGTSARRTGAPDTSEAMSLPHSLSEGLIAENALDRLVFSTSDIKSSQSQEGLSPCFDPSTPLHTVPLSLAPQNQGQIMAAAAAVASDLSEDSQPELDQESKTPVPSLSITASSPADASGSLSTVREKRRFTFGFLADKGKTSPVESGGSAPGSDNGRPEAGSAENLSSPAGSSNTPTRSLRVRMMGLMGKTPTAPQNTPVSGARGGTNVSAPGSMSLKELSSSPSAEDPFAGLPVNQLSECTPETEDVSPTGQTPPSCNNDVEDDDDEVEPAEEADELLVFDPQEDHEDGFQLEGIEQPDESDVMAKPYGEGVEEDESSLLANYWWLASLPICMILFLQFMPLPSWLIGFVTGTLVCIPTTGYAVWKLLREDYDETKMKFVESVSKRVPKQPAIIVQEELERKHVWMNLWPAKNGPYDPLTYDVRRTMSVKVMLYGPWVELRFPKRNLPLRRMYGDKEPNSVAFLEQKEVLDLTNCSVELLPENLPGKRIWSKKYPIRIRTHARKPCSDESEDMKPKDEHLHEENTSTLIPDPDEQEFGQNEPNDAEKQGRDSPPLIPLESVFPDEDLVQPSDEKEKSMFSGPSDREGDKEADTRKSHDTDDSDFEILNGDDSRTFYLFARTSREKEEWFNRLLVGAKFMQDWNHQNPPKERQTRPDPKYETYKTKQQRFRIFMENYFQARHDEGADKIHQMTKDDEEKQQIAREQVACLNIFCARMWYDLHNSKHFVDLLREKITRKLLKVKIAQYFEEVSVTTLDLGQRLPQVLSCSLPWQDEMGLWVNLDIEYNGICQATVETQGIRLPAKDEPDREAQELVSRPAATLDSEEEDSAEEDDDLPENTENSEDLALTPGDHLSVHGAGFRARMLEGLLKSDFLAKMAETDWVKKNITQKQMTLQLQLHSVKGTLTLNMPPAPSDRIWYGFRSPPDLEIALRPCFGGRSLGKYEATLTSVMGHLEKRLKQEFMKVLVYPNLDDEIIPLLNHGPYSILS